MKILFLVVCLAAASQAFDAWSQFKTEFKKEYSNLTEELKRIKIFFENHKKIAAHNARQALGLETHTVAMNEFGDLEQSEFNRLLKGLGNKSRKPTNVFNGVNITVADSIDWRAQGAVTPIKNQGSCGSCWAFSTTGSVEGQLFRKTGKLVSLSEQNLVDCSGSYGNAGCNGGLMDQAFQYIQANGGIDTEDSYPYTGTDGSCSYQLSSAGGTVTGFVDVSSGDETALKAAVGTVGPVSVAIDASHWSFQFYKSGIYHSIFCSSTSLDHGVLAVGYGTESGTDYWIVKNSWGTTWGEQGFFRLSRNRSNHCGIATQASYPTV